MMGNSEVSFQKQAISLKTLPEGILSVIGIYRQLTIASE